MGHFVDSFGNVCDVGPGLVQKKPLTLTVNEIYRSIQGESTWAGLPCVFVRLTFCDLRCSYCDTAYAFYEGVKWTLPDIIERVQAFDCPLVEITGGEPRRPAFDDFADSMFQVAQP